MSTSDTFRMKQDDLKPDLRAQLLDGDTPVDLSAASSARVIVTTRDKATTLIDRAAVIEDGADGWVSMEWQDGDTDTVGRYLLEVEVVWPTDKPQTFPVDGYAELRISEDLDPD